MGQTLFPKGYRKLLYDETKSHNCIRTSDNKVFKLPEDSQKKVQRV